MFGGGCGGSSSGGGNYHHHHCHDPLHLANRHAILQNATSPMLTRIYEPVLG